jgi:hypothetical protein
MLTKRNENNTNVHCTIFGGGVGEILCITGWPSIFFFFVWCWSLNRGSHAGTLPPEPVLPALFILVIFQIGSHSFSWAIPDCRVPVMPPTYLGWQAHAITPNFFVGWDVVLLTSCLVWPQIVILLISTSWVTGITNVYHHAWLHWSILKMKGTFLSTDGCGISIQ